VLKKRVEKIVESNGKTLLLNLESLKKQRTTLSTSLDSENLVQAGAMIIDLGDESRKRVSRELLGRFEEEGEGFLWWIVTGDETCVRHYDSENKQQHRE